MLVKKEQELIESYVVDSSNFKGNADAVFIPETEDEVVDILKQSSISGTKVTISGAGTGLTGARVPQGGIVLSSEKFDKILSVDENTKTIRVQPAVSNGAIAEKLESMGYFIPTNPTERTASIGGNISTNASGARTYQYGAIRNYVHSLKVILSNGDIVLLSRDDPFFRNTIEITSQSGNVYSIPLPSYSMPSLKHAAGYFSKPKMQAIDLFIGSEGTLGYISEIELNYKIKPENVIGLIIFFDNLENIFDFVAYLQNSKINFDNSKYEDNELPNPRLIEFFDSNSLELLRQKYSQIGSSAVGAIWIEQEVNSKTEDEILSNWFILISKFTQLVDDTWSAVNSIEHEKFREFRHTLPEKVFEIVTRNNQHKVGVDAAVPNEYLGKLYNLLDSSSDKYNLDKVIYGHIGNSHLHGNVFFKNENERENANLFYDEVITQVLSWGGTVSAEHGIGKLKVKYLAEMFGKDSINEMKKIKKVLDKEMILNIGNLF